MGGDYHGWVRMVQAGGMHILGLRGVLMSRVRERGTLGGAAGEWVMGLESQGISRGISTEILDRRWEERPLWVHEFKW